eukprot:1145517-Pelagomonas_calceolata.AAC.2
MHVHTHTHVSLAPVCLYYRQQEWGPMRKGIHARSGGQQGHKMGTTPALHAEHPLVPSSPR